MSFVIGLIIGIITGVIGNYVYDLLGAKFKLKKRDHLPRILSDTNSWINREGRVYFYEKEPEYQIVINDGIDSVAERFKKFPDRSHDELCWVEVKYNEATLFGWNFLYLDGYRILIPVPKTGYDTDDTMYDYYDLSSPEIRVFEVIGMANLMGEPTKLEGLKRIANILNITITEL